MHGIGKLLLALALFVPPVLNLTTEIRRLGPVDDNASPVEFDFGRIPFDPVLPKWGKYIQARVIDLGSPSPFRSTYFVRFPRSERVYGGAVVIGRGTTLGGKVVKVWGRYGVALVKALEDPGFRVYCRASGVNLILRGNARGHKLEPLTGSLATVPEGDIVQTAGSAVSGKGSIFPKGLTVGHKRGNAVVPAFLRKKNRWVYLWYDPDLRALGAALGTGFSR